MLELAVRAGLPLIAARTRDVVNFPTLLAHLVGRAGTEVRFPTCSCGGKATSAEALRREAREGKLFWTADPIRHARNLIEELARRGCTMVALNQDLASLGPEFFDAGPLPYPPEWVRGRLVDDGLDAEKVDEVLPGLGGLTLKEARDVVRLAQAETGGLTLESAIDARRRALGAVRGLDLVDCKMQFHLPDENVERYLRWAGPFLLGDYDERLRPRGVLLGGPPGTGKTTAAKRMAAQIGVPLYRLDLGSVKGRWVGESEQTLSEALAQVERESPCVLLIDEVEKLFPSHQSDSGITENLLANLLWWLAEHRARVLTVMTTNDYAGLQEEHPELIRRGRLDEVHQLRGLRKEEAADFVVGLAATFGDSRATAADLLDRARVSLYADRVPQAELEAAVKEHLRELLLVRGKTAPSRRRCRL